MIKDEKPKTPTATAAREMLDCASYFGSISEFVSGVIVARQQMTAASPTVADC